MTTIGLALGGGGARGAAHIGVIYELERLGIRPDFIVGTSVGAMVGVLLAAGYSAAELEEFFSHFTLTQMLDWQDKPESLINNLKIARRYEEALGFVTFEELAIPFAAIATDLAGRSEVVLDSGDVITAVLASMALPVVLPPVELEGRVLVDGGLVNNTAFDVAQKRGLEKVIAVDLSKVGAYGSAIDTPLPTQPMERLLASFFRRPMQRLVGAVVDVVLAHNLAEHLQQGEPDVLLQPDLGTIGIFDFHCQAEAIQAGRAAAAEAEGVLRALKEE